MTSIPVMMTAAMAFCLVVDDMKIVARAITPQNDPHCRQHKITALQLITQQSGTVVACPSHMIIPRSRDVHWIYVIKQGPEVVL